MIIKQLDKDLEEAMASMAQSMNDTKDVTEQDDAKAVVEELEAHLNRMDAMQMQIA